MTPSAGNAARIARLLSHTIGRLRTTATGTVQRRSVSAPHVTTTAATGSRTSSGMGAYQPGVSSGAPASRTRSASHCRHASGATTKETAETTTVAPTASPSDRHSRRTANHSSPIPGVTFVNSGRAQAMG